MASNTENWWGALSNIDGKSRETDVWFSLIVAMITMFYEC